eukprot:1160237-Pelagomonas_calceolata.AAC.2
MDFLLQKSRQKEWPWNYMEASAWLASADCFMLVMPNAAALSYGLRLESHQYAHVVGSFAKQDDHVPSILRESEIRYMSRDSTPRMRIFNEATC